MCGGICNTVDLKTYLIMGSVFFCIILCVSRFVVIFLKVGQPVYVHTVCFRLFLPVPVIADSPYVKLLSINP